jgi:Rap1a immunity proteins
LFLFMNNANATVIDGNKFLEIHKKNTEFGNQYLIGYVAGWYDQIEVSKPDIQKCLGENVRMSQIVDAISIYLENNPQIRHYHPTAFMDLAIKKQFNCH